MYTSIPDGSSSSEDEEADEMIDHTDKNFDEDDQSPPPKRKKSEEIKWKCQKFNSFDILESHLNPIMYFINLLKQTPLAVFDYFVDATLITKITSKSNRYKHQKLFQTSDVSEIDIKKFIAILLIYMSIIRLPRHRMYWSTPTKQAPTL